MKNVFFKVRRLNFKSKKFARFNKETTVHCSTEPFPFSFDKCFSCTLLHALKTNIWVDDIIHPYDPVDKNKAKGNEGVELVGHGGGNRKLPPGPCCGLLLFPRDVGYPSLSSPFIVFLQCPPLLPLIDGHELVVIHPDWTINTLCLFFLLTAGRWSLHSLLNPL